MAEAHDLNLETITVTEPGDPVYFSNDGERLAATNYWQSPLARNGLYCMALNAGCLRLLVPSGRTGEVPEMTTGVREVVVTRGVLNGKDSVEIMFEDDSDAPYSIHLQTKMVKPLWTADNEGSWFKFAIYTPDGMVAEFPCWLRRRVATLPCLQPRVLHAPLSDGAHRAKPH